MTPDSKTLKKIALACRQAGISHYKCADFEITLSPDAPVSNYKKRTSKRTQEDGPLTQDAIDNQTQLTEEQLLLYSAIGFDDRIES